ncbi:unnamed protein product, partial [Meganyctiphanes norvegica]
RYSKARDAAIEFGMPQFGFAAFRYIPETQTYAHASFTFFILGKSQEILLYDTSSMRFLADNGFDFNKLYKKGIPFLSLTEEAKKKEEIESSVNEPTVPKTPIKVSDEAGKKFLRDTEFKVSNFIQDEEEKSLIFQTNSLNGFFRKVLFNNIPFKFPNILVHNVTQNGGDRNVEILKFESSEAKSKFIEEEKRKNLEEKVGFTHVFRKILECGKPMVGHNLILDLFHSFNKLIQPLPESFEQFKTLFKANMPTIYDTKLLAKDPPFCADIINNALVPLFKELCSKYNPPKFEAEEGYMSYSLEGDDKAHDAGYDAFITGVCFITMVKKFDGQNWSKKSIVESKHLELYSNRLNNMGSYDIPYLNIGGKDIIPDRSHIFHVECPNTWTNNDVNGLFHMVYPIKIAWINSTSLYVIPQEETDANKCKNHLKTIQALSPQLVHVSLYNSAKGNKRKSESTESQKDLSNSSPRPDMKRLKSVGSDKWRLLDFIMVRVLNILHWVSFS